MQRRNGDVGEDHGTLSAAAFVLRQLPWHRSALLVAMMLATSLTEGFGLLMLVPLIGASAPGAAASGLAIPGLERLAGVPIGVLLLVFLGLVAVRAGLQFGTSFFAARLTARVTDTLRVRAHRQLMRCEWRWLSAQHGSNHAALVMQQTARIGLGFRQSLGLVTSALYLVTCLGAAFLLSWRLALVGVGVGALLGLLPLLQRRGALRIGAALTEANRDFQEQLANNVARMRAARIAGAQQLVGERFGSAVGQLRERELAFSARTGATNAAIQFAGAASLAVLFYAGIVLWALPLAVLGPVALMLGRLVPLLGTIQQALNAWHFAVPAVADLRAFLAESESVSEPARGDAIAPSLARAITLDRVSVRFESAARPALHDVSLSIPAGTIVAITGQTGAGKSTLADLLCGLLAPDAGQVAVDDVPLAGGTRIAWRDRVAYVEQSPYLFAGTIRDNLTWGIAATDDAALDAAIDRASAQFVRALPAGVDTRITEGAPQFSGGERQRLALVRALLRAPQLLVLDEATSALDAATEAAVVNTIAALRGRTTIVLLGHREAFLALADDLVELAAGRLVAAPRHATG